MTNTMKPDVDASNMRKDTTAFSNYSCGILELDDALKNNKNNNLQWNHK
jgi:hypothetical protein